MAKPAAKPAAAKPARKPAARYRDNLPQLADRVFLTDGGIETTLVFLEGHELPYFAAFDLLKTADGERALRNYFERYIPLATAHRMGFVLESPTWRASADWAAKLGYSVGALDEMNHKSIALMAELRRRHETTASPMVISGCIGPRGDGYDPGRIMSVAEAEAYHAAQVKTFSETEADMVTAITMTNTNEAIGLTHAATAAGMPVAISFTVETDGRLPSGETLRQAIETVDTATGRAPVYYMINCAHPTHFEAVLASGEAWVTRLRGVRANASKRSHAELDQAKDLDAGDPAELGLQYRQLRRRFSHFTVLGGCCGTDHRHVEQICLACNPANGGNAGRKIA